jgi:DNA-binding transcriptional MocR family regulator
MSFQAMTWAVQIELPVKQKIVLLMLANRASPDDRRCIPSIRRLARDCGMSETSVKEALRALRDGGLIEVHQRTDGDVNLSNCYELLMSEIQGVGRDAPGGGSPHAPGVGRHTPPKQKEETENRNKGDAEVEQILSRAMPAATARDLIEHRRSIKKPITRRAAELMVGKLKGVRDPVAVVNRSIENGWSGIFPDKNDTGPAQGTFGDEMWLR